VDSQGIVLGVLVIKWGSDDGDAYILIIVVLLPATGNGITNYRRKKQREVKLSHRMHSSILHPI
jgi:hypothetical protein